MKETDILFSVENDDSGSQLYKLLFDISQIKPNYEAMIKGGHLKVTETGIQPSKLNITFFNVYIFQIFIYFKLCFLSELNVT